MNGTNNTVKFLGHIDDVKRIDKESSEVFEELARQAKVMGEVTRRVMNG